MIDVVFLLIIFFLVSSHLARQESRIPLELPIAIASNEIREDQRRLIINVLPDGGWQIAGSRIDREQIAGFMTRHHERHGEDAQVRIRTDRGATYGDVEPILRAAAGAGLWNASFSVFQERGD